jgi:hypothetical protein
MSEWACCPQCGLKHSLRADGLCPRCRQPQAGAATITVAAPAPAPPPPAADPAGGTLYGGPADDGGAYSGNVYAPPRADLAPAGAPPAARPIFSTVSTADPDEVPTGARIAGLILVLNGIALIIEMSKGMRTGGPSFASFVDIAVGAGLLIGSPRTLVWAKIRVGLGAVLLPILFLSQGNSMLAGVQMAFSLSLLALLIGDAGRLRIGIAMTVLGSYMAFEMVGLMGT